MKPKNITLNHIGYTVLLKNINKAPKELLDQIVGCVSCVEEIDKHSSAIWINLPIRKIDIPVLGHEIVHVLQNIAMQKNIDFKTETEHFGYMYQYIMASFLDMEYEV